jgi:hypothetical protein
MRADLSAIAGVGRVTLEMSYPYPNRSPEMIHVCMTDSEYRQTSMYFNADEFVRVINALWVYGKPA